MTAERKVAAAALASVRPAMSIAVSCAGLGAIQCPAVTAEASSLDQHVRFLSCLDQPKPLWLLLATKNIDQRGGE